MSSIMAFPSRLQLGVEVHGSNEVAKLCVVLNILQIFVLHSNKINILFLTVLLYQKASI